MIRKAPLHSKSSSIALLESDELYFELAAEKIVLPTCEIVYVPDFIALPVSCVTQKINHELASINPISFLDEVESTCRDLGSPLVRLYLHGTSSKLEVELQRRGYQSKIEIGYLIEPTRTILPTHDICLGRVISNSDWRDKLEVHRCEDVGSDGYRNQANAWSELMHRKCETGYKTSFLIKANDQLAGSIAIVESPGLRRVKNLFVLPEFRGQGLAASAVQCVLDAAAEEGIDTAGVFGIQGSRGCSVYEHCGFIAATRQSEYTKRLDLDAPRAKPHPR